MKELAQNKLFQENHALKNHLRCIGGNRAGNDYFSHSIKTSRTNESDFSAIVSNNLNNIMKILTSLTIILTIPTIVGSIYGMNIKLPIAERDDAFIWLVLLTLFICIVTTYYLKREVL